MTPTKTLSKKAEAKMIASLEALAKMRRDQESKPLRKAIKAGSTRPLMRVPKTTAPAPTQATAPKPTAPARISGSVQNAIDLARLQLNHQQAAQK